MLKLLITFIIIVLPFYMFGSEGISINLSEKFPTCNKPVEITVEQMSRLPKVSDALHKGFVKVTYIPGSKVEIQEIICEFCDLSMTNSITTKPISWTFKHAGVIKIAVVEVNKELPKSINCDTFNTKIINKLSIDKLKHNILQCYTLNSAKTNYLIKDNLSSKNRKDILQAFVIAGYNCTELKSKNFSVKFDGIPVSGVIIFFIAGFTLFGGIAYFARKI